MRILCYYRPWGKRYYTDLCEYAFPSAEKYYISDFLGEGTEGLQEKFYFYYKKLGSVSLPIAVPPDALEDIRLRCRLLRNINQKHASQMCQAMWLAIDDILGKIKPDLLFTKSIDSYVLDLLRVYCMQSKIPIISAIGVFINGYFRPTLRGEHIKVREPVFSEVEKVLRFLMEEFYIPAYMNRPGSTIGIVKKSWANQIKDMLRFVHFGGKRWLTADHLNYHYWSSQILAAEHFSGFLRAYIGDRNWQKKLHTNKTRPKVFIPLQFAPELTIDYWCPNVEMINYKEILLKAVEEFSDKGFLVLIKEHPGIVGLRDYGIYRALSRFENAVLIPPQIPGSSVIKHSTCVFVWTGTIGFEAALRGIPVVHVGSPFYVFGERFFEVNHISELPHIIDKVVSMNHSKISYKEQLSLVHHVLSGCFAGNIREKDWKGPESERNAYLREIGATANGLSKLSIKQMEFTLGQN